MEVTSIIGWIVIGGLAGWIAGMVMNRAHGLLMNIIIGIVGGLIGGFIQNATGFPPAIGGHPWISSFIVAFLGACILLLILKLVNNRRA